MARPCTICGHAARADIDAAFTSGSSLDEVLAAFGLPSRSALHRHRKAHLGRPVTFHLPPTASPSVPSTPSTPTTPDASAVLDWLFDRATAGQRRSLQDYARLTVDGLSHIYAAAQASGDLSTAVRALRELRALLQFHALVPADKLRQAPGWAETPVPPDPTRDMMFILMAPDASSPDVYAAAERLNMFRGSGGHGLGSDMLSSLTEDAFFGSTS
jgi:hypothetical protein